MWTPPFRSRGPWYLTKPSFLNLFIKKLTRERVVPIVGNPEVIQPRTRRFPAMTLVRRQRIWQLRPKKACYFGRPYPLT
jgi:hypothetical protein